MTVFLNGRFVPEAEAKVSVFDRSFLYGDGLFETIRWFGGRPFRWTQHMERLDKGAAFLGIKIPFAVTELLAHAQHLVHANNLPESIVRIALSRGVGVRGYSVAGADAPFLVMTCHGAPATGSGEKWRLVTSSFRVPANDTLALYKTCNKLPQIMARTEAEARGANEALLLNTDGHVAEAASSNLFWIEGSTVCTTPLAAGILAGVTRGLVMELCDVLGLNCMEKPITPSALIKTDAVFLTLSSLGIVSVASLDGHALGTSPLVERLRQAYVEAVEKEVLKSSNE